MRVLFLDFDGVLHPLGLQVQQGRFINGKPVATTVKVEFFCWLHVLERLVDQHPDVRFVIHSSWRESHTEEALRAYFVRLSERVLGATRADLPKLESIERWLAEHPEVVSWRILDDAHQEFALSDDTEDPQYPEQFIACDYQTGLADVTVQARLEAWLQ